MFLEIFVEVSFLFSFVLFFSPCLREENVKELIFQNHQLFSLLYYQARLSISYIATNLII